MAAFTPSPPKGDMRWAASPVRSGPAGDASDGLRIGRGYGPVSVGATIAFMKRPSRNLNRQRTPQQLVRRALRARGTDRGWSAVVELHLRASPPLLDLVRSLCASRSWRRRALGLDVAAQLQRRSRPATGGAAEYALDATQALLLAGLRDPHPEVVRAAVSGLWHRPHPDALEPLVVLAGHADSAMRWNVAMALGVYPDPAANDTQIGRAHV